MKEDNSISQELISMGSRLGDFPRSMPFCVPDGFFTDFSVNVRDTIKELDLPDSIPAWSKKLPYSIPEGYFETLTENIYAALEIDIISALPKTTPQHVPVGYFDALPAKLLAAAKDSDVVKKEVKFIPLRRRSANPIRWAAAAVLLMCIGLGSYETFYNRHQANPENMLASVTNNDIQDYLQGTYRVDIDHIISNNDLSNLQVDNKDIVDYLNETGWDQTE